MRTLRIDFTSENILPDGCIAGRIGEHNATALVITPPSEITACESVTNLCIAFMTGVGIIHSEVMPKTETLQIPLWKQLTQYSGLAVQLEAYDDNGGLIVKSPVVSLKLLPSLGGKEIEVDTDNPDLTAQVAKNTAAQHSHNNKGILDLFGMDADFRHPTFNRQAVAFMTEVPDELTDADISNVLSGNASKVYTNYLGKTNLPFFYEQYIKKIFVDEETLQNKIDEALGTSSGSATLKSKYYANDWENGLIGFDLTGADTFFGFFEPLPDNALVYDFSVEFNGKTYMSSELYSKSLISNTSTLNVFGKPEFNSDYGIYLAARTGNDSEGTLYGEISADMGTVTGFTLYYLEV